MRKDLYQEPKSSFLSIAKDTSLIIKKILGNQNILKLIYHTSRDCLKKSKPDITAEQISKMLKAKQISNVPKVKIDKEKNTYIRIKFDDFTPTENPEYRDHIIEIDIVCHFDDWDLEDFELRPYRIAGEIDAMLNKARLSGIGVMNFISANEVIYDEEYGGVILRYLTTHGNDDRINPLS